MMRNRDILFTLGKVVLFAFSISVGCSTPQTPADHSGAGMTCIQGIVNYVSPINSARVPYANATVTAWQAGKDRALVETKADKDGHYCIEIPLGGNRVDLRVWGLDRFERTDYVCEGSATDIDLGSISRECGKGNCLKVDITAQCRERVDRRR
jgi:hypothetical protein